MNLKDANKKYRAQKHRTKQRGLEWLFTFESWCKVWEDSGKWEQRGRKLGCYVMSRINDIGPYSPNNVIIKLHTDNIIEGNIGKHKIKSEEARHKMRLAKLGVPKSDKHRENMRKAQQNRHARAKKIKENIYA